MKKINKDWKTVLKRYSFVAHIFTAISSVTPLIFPVLDYIPMWLMLTILCTSAFMGIVGSFIKQELEEKE